MKFSSLLKKKYRKFDVSIIWWILIPYAAVFLCFTLIMNYMLQFSNDKLQNELYTAHNNTFSAITANISSMKYELDSFALQTSNNKLLLSVGEKYEWDDSDDYYDIYNLNEDFNQALLPYNSIKALCVYYPRTNNFIIEGNILPAEREYEKYYISSRMPSNKSYNSWKDFMISSHNFEMYQSENGDIFYIHSVTKSNDTIATIILDMNEEFFKQIASQDMQNSGIIIYNHLNDVVFSTSENPFSERVLKFDKRMQTLDVGGTSYVQFLDNGMTQMKISYYIEEAEYYNSARTLTSYFYKLIVLFILMLIALSFYVTKVHYRSVSDIMNTLKKFSSGSNNSENTKNEYTYIKNSVQSLSRKLVRTEIEINKQSKISLLSALKKHLVNHQNSMKFSNLLDIYHTNFSFKHYIVALVTINYADENYWLLSRGDDELIFTAVENLFGDYSEEGYQSLLIQLDESTALMLVGSDIHNESILADMERFFVEEKNFCTENLNFDFYVHISDVFEDIDDTKSVYEKLRSTHYINPENAVTFQNNILSNRSYDYGFLDFTESALQQNLENADIEGTKQLLDNVFSKHLTSVSSSFLYFVNIRILNIFSGLTKNLESDEVSDFLDLLNRINPKSASLKDFICLAEYYCKIRSANLTANVRLSAAITEYVNKNFADQSLNVNTLCYEFNRNPSYVSSLFKAETGKMLNQYIAETRLHHAKILLLSDKNIDKIAQECGFSDVAVFRRTFKRYIGVTPSEYRKNFKNRTSD